MPRRQRQPDAARTRANGGTADQAVGGGAGSAAAVATAAALAAAAAPRPGFPSAGLGGHVSAPVREATETVLGAIDALFRQRRGEQTRYVEALAQQEMPHAPGSRVAELAQQELRRELEFQRRARARLAAELPLALQEADAAERQRRVTALIEQEKRYLRQREEAAASRVVAALEQDLLRSISPEGAYWSLSPLVREHTLDCIAMAGKFWPWAVLERYHPQLHHGCQCRLHGLQEAVQLGLMTPDQVPDETDAILRAEALMAEAHRLMESLDPEELEDAIRELEDMRLQEARKRLPARWAAGTVKGGEFKPHRGGERGKASKVALKQLRLGDVATRADLGAVRRVTIKGQDREIPEGAHWEERIGGARFTSPAGGTNLYRDGVLIDGGHPDLVGAAPSLPADEQEPVAVAPTTTAPIPDYTGVQLHLPQGVEGHAGGSTGARIASDDSGRKWLVKAYGGSQDRVATELLANAVYRALGAQAAEAGMIELEGEPDFASIPDVDVGEPPLPGTPGGDKVNLKHTKFVGGKATARISTGIVVRDPDGSVWVYEPKGHFGGYESTFPKGGLEKGLSPQQNAHKELWEETGLHAAITGFVGDFQGDTGISRYYLATRTGGEPHPDDPTPYVKGGSETAAVKRLTPEEAEQALNRSRDKAILKRVLEMPVPEGGQPDVFPAATTSTALTYPLVDGEVREAKIGEPDPWTPEMRRQLGRHYMADALVANWDFVGLTRDNVLWDDEDRPVRIDQGGTFQYRAMGSAKPFGPIPTEVWSMRSPKGQGFGTVRVSEGDMREQARQIGSTLTDARVDELVDAAPFADDTMREEIRDALKARVQWMREFGDGAQGLPTPLEGEAARKRLAQDQQALEVYPEQHAAVEFFAGGGWQDVNAHLRAGKKKDEASEQVRDTVADLDRLLRHTKLDDDVYGYVSFDPSKYGDPEELVGKTLRDDGFSTATLRRGTALAAPGAIRVTVPSGARALYVQGVEGLEDTPRNVELIMPRGARYKVVDVVDGIPEAVLVW